MSVSLRRPDEVPPAGRHERVLALYRINGPMGVDIWWQTEEYHNAAANVYFAGWSPLPEVPR